MNNPSDPVADYSHIHTLIHNLSALETICGVEITPARSRYQHRWRKPRVYLTVVAIAMLGVVAISFGLFYTSLGQPVSFIQDDPDLWLAGTIPFTAVGWLSIISPPTVIAAIALLSARKLGIFISLAILPLLAITFGLSVFSLLRDPNAGLITKVLIDLSIASVMVMLGPLILGWKRNRWKRVSARRRMRVTSLNKLDLP